MTIHLKTLALALIVGAGAPLAAQETEAVEDPAATDTTTEDAAPAEADTTTTEQAAPAEADTQEGQPYVREEFGDWALRCLRAAEGPDPCQLYQLLEDQDGNAVAEFTIFPLPEGAPAAAGITVVAPLETLLTEQLTLSVDGANTRSYPFTFCNRAGCVARVGFTSAEVDQFRRGAEATLRLVPAAAPDEEVILTVSLSGFTAGFDAQTAPAPE